jgi:uncharacterized membrane protein
MSEPSWHAYCSRLPMESRVKIFGHPVHQVLVSFPLGGFGFAAVSDALHARSGQREYALAARWALDFSLITAAVAAPFGLLDWLAIPPHTRAKRVGAVHGLGNLAVVGLFAASRMLRGGRRAPLSAKLLSVAGVALSGVTAWLGAELINRHGIGLDGELGTNAQNSLAQTGRVLQVLPAHRRSRQPSE